MALGLGGVSVAVGNDALHAAVGEHPVAVQFSLAPKINYASVHNSVAFLRELCLENVSRQGFNELIIDLRSDPAVVAPKRWRVEQLGPGERVYIDDRDVLLDAGMLWALTEAVTATVEVRVTSGNRELAVISQRVEVLARNEWGGVTSMPELTAAFVTPNDPAVEKLLKATAAVLEKNRLSPALDGYQSGEARRVAEIAVALWSAVGALGLDYSAPPASFEWQGQKVRTPSHILQTGLGTCLDLTLLFAACLEQAGLNPLVVFFRDHALAGLWLHEETFADVVIDDPASLRNRIQLGEVLVFETTAVTQRPVPSFTVAMEQASKLLEPSQDARFQCVIDVRQARLQRIRPLPSRRPDALSAAGQDYAQEATRRPAGTERVEVPVIHQAAPRHQELQSPESLQTRFERWQRKLLDLSLRNRLLNFRAGRSAVFLHCPDPGKVEDLLAEGTVLAIRPMPSLVGEDSGRSAEIHSKRYHEDIKAAYAREGLVRREIYADLPADELEARLVNLYRQARIAMEEGGANVLYLALGFLVWRKPDDKDQRSYRAPLILVPVRLERRSVRSPMKLLRHDDEPRVNPTLLQMLEQDFRLTIPELLGKPLEDESGLDVHGIWSIVREAVKDIKGWEVTEEVALSTFSFAKYLMWKDLVERADRLKESPVVRHLLETPNEPYPSRAIPPRPEVLDQEFLPNQTFTLLPADSSQLAAIVAVKNGADFVIEGPPGTGKSQTIANIIAQCLAEGRTVLFVAEKRAALEVVYRRLQDVGLGDFCLELHSNKARKVEVLEQLQRAWESQGHMDQEEWAREAARLGRLRDSLNRFVHELHAVHPNGLTPYRAMGEVVRGKDVPFIALRWPSPDTHNRDALERLRELVDRVGATGVQLGELAEHPLRLVERSEWSPLWQSDLTDAVQKTLGAAQELSAALDAFLRACALPMPRQDRKGLLALVTLADVLARAHGRSYAFSLEADAPQVIRTLHKVSGVLSQRYAEAAQLSCRYDQKALDVLDVEELSRLWDQSRQSWFLQRALNRRRIRRALQKAVAGDGVPDPERDLPRLVRIRALDREMAGEEDLLSRVDSIWAGPVGTDPALLQRTADDAQRLRDALMGLYPDPEELTAGQQAVRRLLTESSEFLRGEGIVGQSAHQLLTAYQRMENHLHRVGELAGTQMENLGSRPSENWLWELIRVLNGWKQHAGQLRTWCAWRAVRQEAIANDLKPLVDALEAGQVLPGAIRRAFDVNYCRWWASAVVERSETLRTFVAAEHEHRIQEFRRLDGRFAQLTRDYIRARLCSAIPSKNGVARGSEWGILIREMEKKRRHRPIRQLIAEIPTALTKLTPCLLMSPLSIAQYLPPGQNLFDVVIFDEASQIPVWDAIGAIARGRQTIIVGDPKQLPPTNFFERADQDDEYAEDVEHDLESILDECLAAGLPRHQLLWHYRSRHESLIAFSNHLYYGNRLITFPSPVTDDRAVRFRYVPNGVYEMGGARINKPEAYALVQEVINRLRDPAVREQRLTIGIVTFNAEQQRFIEDLLDNERRRDPSLEPWFSEDSLEPLMVKNLENAQGDERDIIYFSVTYGPDPAGRISMNFGPLNREGGERRLNVAVTRARRELHVFTSLRSDQIDLTRTQRDGVRHLKRFLEYAEHGPRVLSAITVGSAGDFESPFEAAVAAALRERGWEVHPQVGVSNFRIDLGVVDPDVRGRYLAGVECDGVAYHRSATARDRDKLREAVLRGLGWKIVRVWSTDWWTDPQGALDRLDRRLRQLLAEVRAGRAGVVARARTTDAAPTLGAASTDSVGAPTTAERANKAGTVAGSGSETGAAGATTAATAGSAGGAVAGALEEERTTRYRSTARHVRPSADYIISTYREVELGDIPINPDLFFERSYTPTLKLLISTLVQAEGPIRDEVLVRRIARLHGYQRSGSRITERVLAVARREYHKTKEDVGWFFWPSREAHATWNVFRRPPGGEARMVEEIPLEELRVLGRMVLDMGYAGEDALRQMAAMCGLMRLGSNVRARLERALAAALQSSGR